MNTVNSISFQKRTFSKVNVSQFIDRLSQVDWNFINNLSNVNDQFQSFSDTLHMLFEQSFPLRNITVKGKHRRNQRLSTDLKNLANRNVDLAIMARDSGDPRLKALLKLRQKNFRKRLLQEKRASISRK